MPRRWKASPSGRDQPPTWHHLSDRRCLARDPSGTAPLPHGWLHFLARRVLTPWLIRLGVAGRRHSPIGLVFSVGRRSGRSYATPLAIHRRGDRLLIPLTYGPNARWCLNVREAGACRVRLAGRVLDATTPRVLGRATLPRSLREPYRWVRIQEFLELTLVNGQAQ